MRYLFLAALLLSPLAHAERSAFEAHADKMATRYGINPVLLKSICYVENRWKQRDGKNTEIGVCQIKPATVEHFCRQCYPNRKKIIEVLRNPYSNIELAAAHIKWLRDHLGDDETVLMAAYNGGVGVGLYIVNVRAAMDGYALRMAIHSY